MIQIRRLTKNFGGGPNEVHALNDISLDIQPGEIFGIIGLSGAGKSTLVRCMNLLERPTSGTVLVDGKDMTALSEKELRLQRRKITMIFQGFNLLMQRTCLKNVCFPMEIAGVPKARAEKRAEELLDLVGLQDKANAYPAQLSGGQKQRVAVARALATDPKVAICSRVAILDGGSVAELGPVQDIFSNPSTDAARRLVYPGGVSISQYPPSTRAIRISFNGGTAYQPLIASLAIDCGVKVNILGADTRNVGGKAIGTMLLGLPEDPGEAAKALSYIRAQPNVSAEEVEYHE
ncbi:MAG: ATP-binding cassette domain-containing protein [Oscillibacter sp.]|nr:ATP-binding cassette domain-containing protein [Oscillibacter sp.]